MSASENMEVIAQMSFSVQIAASRERVWDVVTTGYPKWIAAVVGAGAQTKGTWEKDAEMEFYAPSGKGGMVARVTTCDKPARVSWDYHAMIQNGKRISFAEMGEQGKMFNGMGERYEMGERDGGVFLEATVHCPAQQRELMNGKWPTGLAKIKELSEAAAD